MAVKLFLVLFLMCYWSQSPVATNPINAGSFIESINFQYNDGKWICGDVQCPTDTFGCKIRIKSDNEDKKVVYQSFDCLDKNKTSLLGAGDRIEIPKEKTIDIELETYNGAKSVYTVGYGLGGNENAKGEIPVDKLDELKERFKSNKKAVDDSNA